MGKRVSCLRELVRGMARHTDFGILHPYLRVAERFIRAFLDCWSRGMQRSNNLSFNQGIYQAYMKHEARSMFLLNLFSMNGKQNLMVVG